MLYGKKKKSDYKKSRLVQGMYLYDAKAALDRYFEGMEWANISEDSRGMYGRNVEIKNMPGRIVRVAASVMDTGCNDVRVAVMILVGLCSENEADYVNRIVAQHNTSLSKKVEWSLETVTDPRYGVCKLLVLMQEPPYKFKDEAELHAVLRGRIPQALRFCQSSEMVPFLNAARVELER